MPSARRIGTAVAVLLFAVSALFLSQLTAHKAATAQTAQIVVQVNDDIITNYDIEQRARILAFSAGRDLPNARALAREALIEDALKLQEAARFGIEISAADVAQAISTIASRNRRSAEELVSSMERAGIEPWAFEHQVRAELAWTQIIRGRYGDSLNPSELEIEAALSNAVSADDVYSLVQLVVLFPSESPSNAELDTVASQARELRTAMTSCDGARQMAESLGAPSGDLGRAPLGQMPEALGQRVAGLGVGEVTEPIPSNVGLHLVMVCDVERSGSADRERIIQRLRQEKADQISRGLLGDLRRSALITELQ